MRGKKAADLFEQGYNCAQAVSVAFCDLTGMTEQQAAMAASSFGGGFGRQREVCGAVSGMCLVLGLLEGYHDPEDQEGKAAQYALVQKLCGAFREEAGSILCRDILKNPPSDPVPSPRTESYYANRPCVRMVYTAAAILDDYIAEHPVSR
jgi:C_GCAxxG_C_C family probable redox protein